MHKLTVQRHVRSKHLLVYKPQHVTDEEDEPVKIPPSDEAAEARAAAVRTYQRRPAREETSEKGYEEGRQRRSPGQYTGGYLESPARSTARVTFRKRRLILDEEIEEEEDAFFTPIDELPRRIQPDAQAEATDSEKKRRNRKRRGKSLATPPKKKLRQASSTLVINERDSQGTRQEDEETEGDEKLRFEHRSKRKHDE